MDITCKLLDLSGHQRNVESFFTSIDPKNYPILFIVILAIGYGVFLLVNNADFQLIFISRKQRTAPIWTDKSVGIFET